MGGSSSLRQSLMVALLVLLFCCAFFMLLLQRDVRVETLRRDLSQLRTQTETLIELTQQIHDHQLRPPAAAIGAQRVPQQTQVEQHPRNAQSVAVPNPSNINEQIRPKPPPVSSDVKIQNSPKFSLTVFVFTYNRPEGLARLFRSLVNADYLGHKVDLTIFVDNKRKFPDKPDSADHSLIENRTATIDWIDEHASWPHGQLRVHKREKNAGLKRSIMEAWYPINDHTFETAF